LAALALHTVDDASKVFEAGAVLADRCRRGYSRRVITAGIE